MLTIPWVLLAASAAAASAAASGLDLKNDQQLVPPGPPERGVGAAPGVGRTTAGVHVWGEEDVASGAEARSAAEEPDSSTRESDRSPTRRLLDRSRQLASTRTPLGRSRRLLGFTGLGKKITNAVTTAGNAVVDAVVDTVNTVGAAVNTLKDAKINCDIGEYVSKKMNTGFVNCDSCIPGQYIDMGGHTITGCKLCPSGYSTHLLDKERRCTKCDAGTFSENVAQPQCFKCPAGFIQPGSGGQKCAACSIGKYELDMKACVNCVSYLLFVFVEPRTSIFPHHAVLQLTLAARFLL